MPFSTGNFIRDYLMLAIIAMLLLIFLPPFLVPYFGVFGAYASNAVTILIIVIAIWVNKKTQKAV